MAAADAVGRRRRLAPISVEALVVAELFAEKREVSIHDLTQEVHPVDRISKLLTNFQLILESVEFLSASVLADKVELQQARSLRAVVVRDGHARGKQVG